jgi:hypothetical protein
MHNLVYNNRIISLVESNGMKIMNVAWEDTGRTKNSCFGPNISDMTLSVDGENMPIIRKPNFADLTSDQDIEHFSLVINDKIVSLKEYLQNIGQYTKNDKLKSMYLERDNKILTSAQACILPLTTGSVEFNIKLYNYQSYKEPAVLIIVSSSEGTSTQIVKGKDCTLYFDKNGQNANFIAERLSDDRKKRNVSVEGAMTHEEKQRNALLIFQIPLKIKRTRKHYNYLGNSEFLEFDCSENCLESFSSTKEKNIKFRGSIGLEDAVISTSNGFGKFIGTNNLALERDSEFPIRCTIQYYKVSDTDEIKEEVIKNIATQINKQYDLNLDTEKGSLVMENNKGRLTEHNFVSKILNKVNLFTEL